MPSAVAGSNCGHIHMPSAPRELRRVYTMQFLLHAYLHEQMLHNRKGMP